MRFIGNVEEDTQIRAVASGTLSNGDTVVVNSDGTVSAISGESAAEAAGSKTTFNAANSQSLGAAFDANAGKVVIAFQDYGASGSGRAVVGTVSGTSITFGTEVQYESGSSFDNNVIYDANAQKIVIVYRDNGNSDRPKAVVGTVSGTSITFGSIVTISSNSCTALRASYDPTSTSIIVVRTDTGNSYYGTANVGTVSGTSISFGTDAVFNSATTYAGVPAGDVGSGKVVVGYRDNGNSGYGTAKVGTVSGSSISFGSATVFKTASTEGDNLQAIYDPDNQKTVIVYMASGIKAKVGTVSGTSISFGSEATTSEGWQWSSAVYDTLADKIILNFGDTNASYNGKILPLSISGTTATFGTAYEYNSTTTRYTSGIAFDSAAGKSVAALTDWGTDYQGKAVVYQAAYSSTNITATNFIGFADSGYLSGQNVGIDSTGSVNRSQSGLTAGQKYYVQNDGSLGTTADDPSVEAGVAISATEILVKG